MKKQFASQASRRTAVPPGVADASGAGISSATQLLFAAAVGVVIVNLFATQTLLGAIAPALGLAPRLSGLLAMLPQLGYATGLILLVPLADLVENRMLIQRLLAGCAVALTVATVSTSGWLFLLAIFLAGAASSAIQVMVPLAALMAPAAHRGRVVGNVMSGLMLGILLARPLSSLMVDLAGWRFLYLILALSVGCAAVVLSRKLPQRLPHAGMSYASLILSLWHLLCKHSVLRRRALTAALAMGTFSLFWTAVALLLAQSPFGLNQRQIALFALAGAGGAVAAPLAGRLGDRGWTRPASVAAHLLMIVAILVAGLAGAGWGGFDISSHPGFAMAMLVLSAIALDAGVTTDQTLGRRAINLLPAEERGRLNGLFVGIFFVGGAFGAASASLAWERGGWTAVCILGTICATVTLCAGLLQRR